MNNKNLAIVLILTITISSLSLLTAKPTTAQSITKPSVPEFTIKYVDRSYDTQPTYGVDQYTGKTVITKSSEHVDNRTLEITIKNQPFTQFTDASSGRLITLYYNVRHKGSFGQDWTLLFSRTRGTNDPLFNDGYPSQDSSSQNTIISYTLQSSVLEGQIDVQVEALKGYVNRTVDPLSHILFPIYDYTLYGEESGWSNTQTIAIGQTSTFNPTPNPTLSPTNTPSPSPSPTVPEFPSLTIPLLLSIILGTTGLLVYHKKHKQNLVKDI